MIFLPPLETFQASKCLQPKLRALPAALLPGPAAHQGSQGEGIRTERLRWVLVKQTVGFIGENPWENQSNLLKMGKQ